MREREREQSVPSGDENCEEQNYKLVRPGKLGQLNIEVTGTAEVKAWVKLESMRKAKGMILFLNDKFSSIPSLSNIVTFRFAIFVVVAFP